MSLTIKDKVCVITGCGKIGKVLAQGLYEAGAIVFVCENNKEVIHEFSKEYDLAIQTGRLWIIELDISRSDSIINFLSDILSGKYGVSRIDAWINTAFPKNSEWGKRNISDEYEFLWHMERHLGGYYLTSTKVAYLIMQNQKDGGSVINFSSIYGERAPKFYVYEETSMKMPILYAMMKGAINMMSKYLAAFFGKSKIRFNVISPGGIFENQPWSFIERYDENVPLNRMGTETDIVGLVIFLVSDSSKYITGQNIFVDGGWTAW